MPLSDLNRCEAHVLARLVASRQVSAIEVVDAALARLEEVEPELNAFTHVEGESARAAARDVDRAAAAGEALGPLAGVPVSVKDLIDVGGMPARYGSLTLHDRVAAEDAPSVARLRAAGSVILGKTATSEFGYRGYTKSLVHGNTRNPWNLGTTPGGSSGGAVASVAAGVSPVALGTDGGGSIRSPAAFTGLVGIKAQFGRVPVWPASATPTLAHVGPIARRVADAALLLAVIAGQDLRDPSSLYPEIGPEPHLGSLRSLRVAFSPTLGYAHVDAPVAECVRAAVHRLEAVFPSIELVEDVCPDPAEILVAEFIGGCSARLGDLVDRSSELIDPPLLEAVKQFRELGSDRYTRLLRRRVEHREIVRRFFERYDLLLTPTTPCLAWNIESGLPSGFEQAKVWSYFTYPFNLTGQPAASLPCGFSEQHAPIGLQIVAPMLGEARLIAAMRAVEHVLGPADTPIEIRRAGEAVRSPPALAPS